MRNKIIINPANLDATNKRGLDKLPRKLEIITPRIKLPEVLVITTFPPRECGIATYSQDLILALNNKFTKSFAIKIAALELENEKHIYTDDIYAVLETDNPKSYVALSKNINENSAMEIGFGST